MATAGINKKIKELKDKIVNLQSTISTLRQNDVYKEERINKLHLTVAHLEEIKAIHTMYMNMLSRNV